MALQAVMSFYGNQLVKRKRAGAIRWIIFSLAVLYVPCSSAVNSNHTTIASPSSKVGSFLPPSLHPGRSLGNTFQNLHHSTGSLLEKGAGKLMCFPLLVITKPFSATSVTLYQSRVQDIRNSNNFIQTSYNQLFINTIIIVSVIVTQI